MKNWFVCEATRKGLTVPEGGEDTERQIIASVAAVAMGFEVHVPLMQRYRRGRDGKPVEITVPRFGAYLFVKFDRDVAGWQDLMTERTHFQYFRRVLSNAEGRPVPVPDRAMDAIRAYRPPSLTAPETARYEPGQRVSCIMAGRRMDAVFVEYCGGNRPMIRTWIFGTERMLEVSSAQLEPAEAA